VRKVTGFFIVILLIAVSAAFSGQNCFTAVAGRLATADGSVLVAHNEDNLPYACRMLRFERVAHEGGEFVELAGGGRLAQADTSWGYLIFEMPGVSYSQSLLNEHGVGVTSDNCPSREDRPELTDGGIGPRLRILVAERARTAREGVKLVGSLVEKFGYAASGRTLIICDPREGWLVAMVNGKHWAAARVPDDQVAMIANSYSIHEVALSDTLNFLGSRDIIDYAVKRGWYDPGRDGPFDFERAYAEKGRISDPHQKCRQWSGYRHVAAKKPPFPEDSVRLPFSVKPIAPLKPGDLFAVLRDHYEGSPIDLGTYSPHAAPFEREARPICAASTNHGFVFQLRPDMPVEIGALWWLALSRPCSSPFLPLYYGLKNVPGQLYFEAGPEGDTRPGSTVQPGEKNAWLAFRELSLFVDGDFWKRVVRVRAAWEEFEGQSFALQQVIEGQALANWERNKDLVLEGLGRYCQGALTLAVQQAGELKGLKASQEP